MSETPLVTPVDPNTLNTKPVSTGSRSGIVFAVVIILGLVLGFMLSKGSGSKTTNGSKTASNEMVNTETEVGSKDTATFRDTATGTLEIGGLNGEGTHKLIRDGGPTKTAYLISSIVDLDQFAGKKVQIWGETVKAQRVGWLMDVGRVKLVE
jgi:hypothetical protein